MALIWAKKLGLNALGLLLVCGLWFLFRVRTQFDNLSVATQETTIGHAGNPDKQIAVLEDVEGVPNGDEVEPIRVVSSRDGKRSANVQAPGPGFGGEGYCVVVFDGNTGKSGEYYAYARNPVFSPDGMHVAYPAAKHGSFTPIGDWFMVEDGKEGNGYFEIGDPVFSPDGMRLAYKAQVGTYSWLIVVDEVKGQRANKELYDGVSDPVFSPDGKRLAYVARRGDRWLVVIDGVKRKENDGIVANSLVFSPDGKWLAYKCVRGEVEQTLHSDGSPGRYSARRGDKMIVTIDGAEGQNKEYDGFPKGSRVKFDSINRFRFLAIRGQETVLVEGSIVRQSDRWYAALAIAFALVVVAAAIRACCGRLARHK